LVADFNAEAQRLYEQVGYKQVGVILNLYKEGAEHLMMKEVFFVEYVKPVAIMINIKIGE